MKMVERSDVPNGLAAALHLFRLYDEMRRSDSRSIGHGVSNGVRPAGYLFLFPTRVQHHGMVCS